MLYFLLSLYLFGLRQPAQTSDAVRLSGICFDVTTAVYLPVEVFAIVGTTRTRLGQSDKEGKFNLLLPRSATSISFSSPAYRAVTLPVSFANAPGSRAAFRLGIIMGKRDSAAVQQLHQLLVSNNLPDSLDVDYSIEPVSPTAGLSIQTTAHGNRVPAGMHTILRKGGKLPSANIEGARPGSYRAVVSTVHGQMLVDETFAVHEGLTLFEVQATALNNPDTDRAAAERSRSVPDLSAPTTVYFEQSRYELVATTKAALDSVVRRMQDRPLLVAHITGYTDNVGEQNLNLTLSEYRAKRVASYLKTAGIADTRLRVDWQGGKALVASGKAEADKARNRRVVIQLDRK